MALSLLILVGLFIARPFLLPTPRPGQLTPRQQLLAQKEALLAQIRALDFDAETGKQLPADYQAERTQLLRQAATIQQQLEQQSSVEDEIEAAVQHLRQNAPAAVAFCPQCGHATQPADLFCAQCGHKLQEVA